MRTFYLLLGTGFVLFTFGCGGDGASGPSGKAPPIPPIVAPNATVIDGSNADDVIVEPSRLIFPAAGNDDLLAHKAGDVLVGRRQTKPEGHNPYGFLRKVVKVAKDSGTIVIDTSQATLEDAIEQGEGSTITSVVIPSRFDDGAMTPLSQPQSWGPGLSPLGNGGLAGGEIDVSGKVLDGMAGGGLTVSISRGKFNFDPDVDMGIQIKGFKVQEFHTILSGSLAVELALQVAGTVATSKSWEGDFFELSKPLPPIMIGPVPVEVTMQFKVSGGAEVSVEGEQTIEAGAGASSSVSVGGRYQRGQGWSKVANSSFSLYPIGPTIESKTSASVKAFVPRVSVTFLLYDAAGPFIDVSPYAQLTVESNQPCPWELTGGIEGNFGATLQVPVIGYTLAEASLSLFDVDKEIVDGNLPPAICGVEDAGAETSTPPVGEDAGTSADSGIAPDGGTGNDAGTGVEGGTSGSTCLGLAYANGWDDLYCETGGNGACQGKGPATSDCDHCCTGHSCADVVAEKGWTSTRCETDGNGLCGGQGIPTFDCDVCCGSTCDLDTGCSGGDVCAWNGLGYCCRTPGAQGDSCFSDAECDAPELCAWNGTKFVCTAAQCNDATL